MGFNSGFKGLRAEWFSSVSSFETKSLWLQVYRISRRRQLWHDNVWQKAWTSVNGKRKRSAHDTRNIPVVVGICGRQRASSIAGLHPQSLRRFSWKLIARVSQTCVPPTLVTWLQLSRKKTNPGNSISVTAD